MFDKLRHNFVRKGLVLVVVDNIKMAKYESKKLVNDLYSDIISKGFNAESLLKYRYRYEIKFNKYRIKFISKNTSFNSIRGMRPEIVYWCLGSNYNLELEEQLKHDLCLSSRLQPFRFVKNIKLDQDILTDDFKIKDYINTKSRGYKLTRNDYIHKQLNKFQNKLKQIINRKW